VDIATGNRCTRDTGLRRIDVPGTELADAAVPATWSSALRRIEFAFPWMLFEVLLLSGVQ
jgi:hypothetical protein